MDELAPRLWGVGLLLRARRLHVNSAWRSTLIVHGFYVDNPWVICWDHPWINRMSACGWLAGQLLRLLLVNLARRNTWKLMNLEA